jgi:hypothetical protein
VGSASAGCRTHDFDARDDDQRDSEIHDGSAEDERILRDQAANLRGTRPFRMRLATVGAASVRME